MSERRVKPAVLAGVAVVAAVVVGLAVFRGFNQHAIALRAVPPRPSVEPALSVLETELRRAEAGARGYFQPAKSLAELSRLYHANGFSQEAGACYAGLAQLEPHEARWPHLQAGLLAGFGELERAQPLEERAVALQPDYLPAALRLGDIQLKQNRPAAAIATYTGVLRRDAHNGYALLGLAKCEIGAGNWNAAREHLRTALVSAPDFVGALSLMVTVEEHAGDLAAADALRSKIGKHEYVDFPDPWADELPASCFDPYRLSVAAATAQLAGDAATARRWLERAITLDASAGIYRRQLGKLFFSGTRSAARARTARSSRGDFSGRFRCVGAARRNLERLG